MALVVPDLGEQWLLETMLRRPIPSSYPLYAGLWTNVYTVRKDSVLADLTAATFTGYAMQAVQRTDWGAAANVGGVAQVVKDGGPLFWEPSAGSQLIQGVYFTDPTQTILLWLEALGTPFTTSPGFPVAYLPLLRLNSLLQP